MIRNLLFFLIIFYSTLYANNDQKLLNIIEEKQLYNSYIWKSLLHVQDNKPQINSPTFLLSFDNFSLKNEMIKTIDSFNNNKHICKYPARYLWLSHELKDLNISFPTKECSDFNTYQQKTNPEQIDIVFSSEDIKNPSSMMGHVFFKITGNVENKKRENAVSFYTVIDTINIPWLMIKSTMIGMKGYFILYPYKKQLHHNLYNEKRSIWEYELNLSKEQIKLITYHFWELKDIDIKYLFTGFNCATIVDDILALSSKEYQHSSDLWVTPKDVIKKAKENNLIKKTNLLPTIEWELYMYNDLLSQNRIKFLINLIDIQNIESIENLYKSKKLTLLDQSFLLTYTNYAYIQSDKVKKQFIYDINLIFESKNIQKYSITNAKDPTKSVNDSQLSFSYTPKESKTNIQFLGASNTIYDDNRGSYSEKSLEIGKVNLKINKKVKLEEFTFYNMESLIPYVNPMNDISKSFLITYKDMYNFKDKKTEKYFVFKGGPGITYKPHDDIIIYSLANLKFDIKNTTINSYATLKAGLNIYEIFNNKSTIFYEYFYNLNDTNLHYSRFDFVQSIFIKKSNRFDIKFSKLKNKNYNNESISFNLTHYF